MSAAEGKAVIETERLILRPCWESDYGDLFEFLSQLEDDEFEGYPGITYANGREHLKARVGSSEFLAVEKKETGRVIGNIYCGIRPCASREIGYIINENCRRRGYALETLSAVVRRAFEEGAHRVYAECDPRNTRSWKLLEKAGFRREARLRKNVWFRKDADGNPVWKDMFVYALLPEDLSEGAERVKEKERKRIPDGSIAYRETRDFTPAELERLFLSVGWSSGHFPRNRPKTSP